MSACALIAAARAEGLTIGVEGNNLVIETDRDPPAALLAKLREDKAELIAVLSGDDPEERAAIIEEGARVPRAWAEGYAALCAMPPPVGVWPERWQRIIDATGAFLDRWAGEAIRCGWSDLTCSAATPVRTAARFDAMGLVLLLDRCEVVGDRPGRRRPGDRDRRAPALPPPAPAARYGCVMAAPAGDPMRWVLPTPRPAGVAGARRLASDWPWKLLVVVAVGQRALRLGAAHQGSADAKEIPACRAKHPGEGKYWEGGSKVQALCPATGFGPLRLAPQFKCRG